MSIISKKSVVYCFFEQSGTFKNEFKKLGYKACDYDILNDYNETDNIMDLYGEIEKGFNGGGGRYLTKLQKNIFEII